MSLFDSDIIEKEVHVPLIDQFCFSVIDKLQAHRKDILATRKTHGPANVCNLIFMYIVSIKNSTKYNNILCVEGQMYDPKDRRFDYKTEYPWVEWKDGYYFITIPTDDYSGFGDENYWENYGNIHIVLNQYGKVLEYNIEKLKHEWWTI
jgi:hypothetical protein